MELDEHQKIDELLRLERDNNRMLHRMHRGMIWGHFFTFFYWLVVLGSIGASYYYLEPYITKYWNTYQSAVKTLNDVEKAGKSLQGNLGGLLEKVR